MSSIWKLPLMLIILVLFCLLQIAGAVAITPQTSEGMSEQIDATLARYFQKSYATAYKLEESAKRKGLKPGQGIGVTSFAEEHKGGSIYHGPLSIPAPTPLPYVWGSVIHSDMIVIGTPVQSRSLFIEDHTFLFTEYTVKVEKVLAPEHSNVLPGDTIIVSRGGGQIVINNVLVTAINSAFTQITLNQPYIFMLQSIPDTQTYQAYGAQTYAIRQGQVLVESTSARTVSPPKDLSSFLADVNAALERKRTIAEDRKRSATN